MKRTLDDLWKYKFTEQELAKMADLHDRRPAKKARVKADEPEQLEIPKETYVHVRAKKSDSREVR